MPSPNRMLAPAILAAALLLVAVACDRASPGGDGADTAADGDADGDTESSTENGDECEEGWIDCDGLDDNGCETAVAEAPPEYAEYGCCHPFDEWDNQLTDCDEDGYCECYGTCGDPPDDDECWGE